MNDASQRTPWTEGPDEEAAEESWLRLDDDELLHRIETLPESDDEDDRLVEVVESNRHFFIRQEAAKRVRDRTRLFVFEDDRHVGQILVRHLTRREDVTYLERLSDRSRHVEVRAAAQVQLARLWKRLDAPKAEAPRPKARPSATSLSPPAPKPATSAALERDGVDASLLGWAAHFVVEHAWNHLGTHATRELLVQTRRELLGQHPTLVLFEVSSEARVAVELDGGLRLPAETVPAVAAWLTSFRTEAARRAPEVGGTSLRALTALMADALRDAGFYAACDESEVSPRG